MSKSKRIVSLFLVVVMLVSVFGVSALAQHTGPYVIFWDDDFDIMTLDNMCPYDEPLYLCCHAHDDEFAALFLSEPMCFADTDFGEAYIIFWDDDFDIMTLDNMCPYEEPLYLLSEYSSSDAMAIRSTTQATVRNVHMRFRDRCFITAGCVVAVIHINVTFDTATGRLVSILNPQAAFNTALWMLHRPGCHVVPSNHNARITGGSGNIMNTVSFSARATLQLGYLHSNVGALLDTPGSAGSVVP